MRLAVISDVHSNLEAFQAVLDDISSQGITDIVCLGDLVGYGPDPIACICLADEVEMSTVRGNHEVALFEKETRFNPRAMKALKWTEQDLADYAKVVPVGVDDIMQLQEKGFAYMSW